MATVVNNPPASSDSGSGMGMVVGVLVLIAVIILLVLFVMPMLRDGGGTDTTIQEAPTTNDGGGVTVPDEIDVNVNPGTDGGQ